MISIVKKFSRTLFGVNDDPLCGFSVLAVYDSSLPHTGGRCPIREADVTGEGVFTRQRKMPDLKLLRSGPNI